jgi:acyl dehydratase
MPEFQATGRYLEDFIPGEGLVSPGRTLTSGDIDLFEEWTADTFSRQATTENGRRMINPTLVVNVADALMQRAGIVECTGYCNIGWKWKFHQPVYEMDTLWASARWNTVRPSRSIPGVGIVEMTVDVINQHEITVAVGEWAVMVLRRGSAASRRA